jgi:hypothetical protein
MTRVFVVAVPVVFIWGPLFLWAWSWLKGASR